MNRRTGHIAMWAGFLGAALTALRHGEEIVWLWYLLWLAIGIIGVVILRATAKTAAGQVHKVGADVETMKRSLKELTSALDALGADRESIDVYDVHRRIDDRLVTNLAAFADARESMIPSWGLDVYAEVMTEFAGAERMINRAWSASADGYIDEVWLSIDRAQGLMSSARTRFESAASGAS